MQKKYLKENLEKVLDKFFQEDYNKAGSGLGLAISNEIVKLHGGKMILNSKKGVGTSITVKIKNTFPVWCIQYTISFPTKPQRGTGSCTAVFITAVTCWWCIMNIAGSF